MDWGTQGDKNQHVYTEDESMFPSHGDREDSYIEMREGCGQWLDDQNQAGCVIVLVFGQDQGWIDGPSNGSSLRGGHCTWISEFFSSPDALSLADIRSHKQQLGQACKYDKQNLYYSHVYLENSIDIQL